MQKENISDKTDKFKQICKDHKLKITPQRVAIYREILDLETHPTAHDIFQGVIKEYPNISFDTVNRTLLTFADIGIVDVIETFGGAKRFDPNVYSHHHLHCVQCGKVFDFKNSTYDNLVIPEDVQSHFQVKSRRVVLKGVCSKCRN